MSNAMTVRALFEKYVAEHEEGLAPSTIEFYRSGVAVFERFLERVATIDDLTKEKLFQYSDWLVATYQKKSTAAGNFRTVKALSIFAAREDLIEPITKMRKIKVPSSNPTAWTDEETRSLINTALAGVCLDGKTNLPNGPSKGLFFACLFSLAWDTSLRLGDQRLLKWTDLTMDKDGTARAVIPQNKTGNLVPVSIRPETMKLLEQLRKEYTVRTELLLDYPVNVRTLYRSVKSIVKAAGVREGGMRYIRRGSATYAELLQPGAGKVALGHRSDWTSQTHYLDQTILAKRTIDKPNVLEAGVNGNPLIVIKDVRQGSLKDLKAGTAEEIEAGRLVHLAYVYGDEPIPAQQPRKPKAVLADYSKVALEFLYDHCRIDIAEDGHITVAEPYDEDEAISLVEPSDIVKSDKFPRYGHVICAKLHDRIVGVAECNPVGFIHRLAVASEHRRNGVGTALVREIVRRCGVAEAYTEQRTEGGAAFLKALGFQYAPSDSMMLG